VTTEHEGRRNIMAAAWSMPVEFTPPRIAVVVDKKTYTADLLQASGRFALCLPVPALADLTYRVGSESGRDIADGSDKFVRHRIDTFTGPELGLPLVAGCCAPYPRGAQRASLRHRVRRGGVGASR
jgi:flavin reductase (DIM6/NTAB) family NADH-FMN oxidoreductase RutF